MFERQSVVTLLSVLAGFIAVIVLVRVSDGTPPTVTFLKPFDVVGSKTGLNLRIEDMRSGLKHVSVKIKQGEEHYLITDKKFDEPRWFTIWKGGGTKDIDLALIPYKNRQIPRKESTATLIVTVEDYSWRKIFTGNRENVVHEFQTKFKAPKLERISSRHVINQGGAELVRYRVSPDAFTHGVVVGDSFYPGYSVSQSKDSFALLAFPFSVTERLQIFLIAKDLAGNESKVPVPYDFVRKNWRQRQINIDDDFIQKTVSPLIAQSADIDASGDSLSDFLAVNTVLRDSTNEHLAKITQQTSSQRLWRGVFLQMSNSQVQALFADRRDYYYNGEKVDEKDHLGYDLASLKNYPVEASNTGVVIFSNDLGLYGNTVIIDHGYGLQSLYGHLASFTVEVGEKIKKGEIVGYTGSTGMAGGDHLHFSMLVHGHQVNPLEWWDREWIGSHIEDRLTPAWSK